MTRFSAAALVALALANALACSPAASQRPVGPLSTISSTPGRALSIAIRTEPPSLAQKVLSSGVGTSFAFTQRAFNATLGLYNGQGEPEPYLAQTLPELGSGTWQTFPDGRMETTYHLKPRLTWHDGSPLTAADFAFAWQVYSSPLVGIANVAPQSLIDDVSATDGQTVVIRWNRPYPRADVLAEDDFPPLPQHLLRAAFDHDPAGLATVPFWTTDYVGAGPYKLSRWEPGSSIEGIAFVGHSLTQPQIGRIRFVFIADSNVALANLLSGDVDFATDSSIRFAEGQILRQQWGTQHAGTVLMRPGSYRGVFAQLRPDVARPRALLDVRVRQALAHAINRTVLNDGLFDGQGVMSEVPFISPSASYFSTIAQAVAIYPYDLRAAERLTTDAGFSKGADGFFASPAEGTLHFEVSTLAGPYRDAELATLASGWREAGFDFKESFMLPALAADNQARATFPGLFSYSTKNGEYSLAAFTTSAIGTPDNRWIGPNRSGWSNPEFDRLSGTFARAIAPADRVQLIAQMAKLMSEEVPTIPLMFELAAYAHRSALRGPTVDADEAVIGWNVQDWMLN